MADGEYKFEDYQGVDINTLLGKLATFLGNGNVSMGLQTLISEINAIKEKIPVQATVNNKLADKAHVNSCVEQYVNTQIGGEVSDRNSAIAAAINALDAVVSMAMNANGLSLSVTQVNGKLTVISGSLSMDGTPTAGSAKPVTSAGVKSYVDGEVSDEATARQLADEALQDNIDAEEGNRQLADGQLNNAIGEINSKISNAASSSNKLTAKSYVDEEIAGVMEKITEEAFNAIFN